MHVGKGYVLSAPNGIGKVEPEIALCFYNVNDRLSVLEHPLSVSSRGPVIGAGRALSSSSVHGLLCKLARQRDTHGLLPHNLLVNDPGLLAWFVPGQVRRMWFRGEAAAQRQISMMVPWPSLLFVVRENQLSLAALRGKSRPDRKTLVYHSPLMNVYEHGGICMGTNASADTDGVSAMEHWETVVFNSNFTHVNHDSTLALKPKADVSTVMHMKFWRELSKKKTPVFPSNNLRRMGRMTLDSFIFGGE